MAFGVKYQWTFQDRSENDWRVQVLRDGYSGSVNNVQGGRTQLKWGKNSDNKYEPIIASELTASFWATSVSNYSEFAVKDEELYRVRLQRSEGGFPAFASNHTHRYEITIQSSKVSATISNYLLYIDLADMPASFWTNLDKSDGGDIRVGMNGNQCPCYVNAIDTGSQTGYMFVKLAEDISDTSNTGGIYVYVGDTGVSTPAVGSTFGRNNTFQDYEAFWDMEQDPSGSAPQLTDLTGNGNDGTSAGSMTSGDEVAGKVGNAWDFDGTDDWVDVSNPTFDGNTEGAISMWVNVDALFGSDDIEVIGGFGSDESSTPTPLISLQKRRQNSSYGDTNTHWEIVGQSGGLNCRFGMDNGISAGQQLLVFTGDGSNYNIFLNGAEESISLISGNLADEGVWFSQVSTTTNITYGIGNLFRGGSWSSVPTSDKTGLKNIRASIPSSDLISTEYNNQNSPSTFYSVGSEEAPVSALNYSTYWVGQLISDQYSEIFTDVPYEITLRATDGLGRLKNIPYVSSGRDRYDSFYSGRQTLMEIITNCLSKINTEVDTLFEYIETYETTHTNSISASPLPQTEVDVGAFNRFTDLTLPPGIQRLYKKEPDYPGKKKYAISCYEVLENILTIFGARIFLSYQDELGFRIKQINSYDNSSVNRRKYIISTASYDSAASVDDQETLSTSNSSTNVVPINKNQEIQYLPAKQAFRSTFQPKNVVDNVFNNFMPWGEFELMEDENLNQWNSSTDLKKWTETGTIERKKLEYWVPGNKYTVKLVSTNAEIVSDVATVPEAAGILSNKFQIHMRFHYEVDTFLTDEENVFGLIGGPYVDVEIKITDGTNTYYMFGVNGGEWTTNPQTVRIGLGNKALFDYEGGTGQSEDTVKYYGGFNEAGGVTDFIEKLEFPATAATSWDCTVTIPQMYAYGDQFGGNGNDRVLDNGLGGNYTIETCYLNCEFVRIDILNSEDNAGSEVITNVAINSNVNTSIEEDQVRLEIGDAVDGIGFNIGTLKLNTGVPTGDWNYRGGSNYNLLELLNRIKADMYDSPSIRLSGDFTFNDAILPQNTMIAGSSIFGYSNNTWLMPQLIKVDVNENIANLSAVERLGAPAPAITVFDINEEMDHTSGSQVGASSNIQTLNPSSFLQEYEAILSKAESLGYSKPSGIYKDAGNQLIADLKLNGLWETLDALWIFATNGDRDFAKLNWIDPDSFEAGETGSPTFGTGGFTGDGAGASLQMNYNPTTDATNYALNTASFGIYVRALNGTGQQVNTGTNDRSFLLLDAQGDVLGQINDGTTGQIGSTPATGEGLWHLHSIGATYMYQNDNLFATLDTAVQIPNSDFELLRDGTGGNYSNDQVSIFFVGGDLESDTTQLFNALEKYMDAIGEGVV